MNAAMSVSAGDEKAAGAGAGAGASSGAGKFPDGKMITISYDTTDYKTMYLPELLQRIEDITGIPAAQMSVSGNGKLLQEGRKIGDYYGGGYNISPGTTISVMLKLPKKEAAKDADSSKDADKADS